MNNIEEVIKRTNGYLTFWYIALSSFVMGAIFFMASVIATDAEMQGKLLDLVILFSVCSTIGAIMLITSRKKVKLAMENYMKTSKTFKLRNKDFNSLGLSMLNSKHRQLYSARTEKEFKDRLDEIIKKSA